MRCKVGKTTLFMGKSGYKNDTVNDTIVSFTVSVMVTEAGLDLHFLPGVHDGFGFLGGNPPKGDLHGGIPPMRSLQKSTGS